LLYYSITMSPLPLYTTDQANPVPLLTVMYPILPVIVVIPVLVRKIIL